MEEIVNQERDYQKLLKLIFIGAVIGLVLTLILGYVLNSIFYAILIYMSAVVSVIGYIGGIWLWEYLATSELLNEEMKSMIKRLGWVALIGFIILISATGVLSFTAEASMLITIVNLVNWLLLFMLAYNVGYLISIWREPMKLKGNEVETSEFVKVDWRIIKKVFRLAIPGLLIIFGATLVVGIIQGDLNVIILPIGIQLLLFLGFCVGYIIWEHLKRTDLIEGKFKAQLKWISVVFLIISGGLTIYGFIIISTELIIIQILRELILYYAIFLLCLFFYFLGLYVSILKSE